MIRANLFVLSALMSTVQLCAGQYQHGCDLWQLALAGSCDFYSCLESYKNCGPTGYMSGYASHLCRQTTAQYNNFNSNGQHWLFNSQRQAMVSLMHQNPMSRTCSQIQEYALNSMSNCYLSSSPGLCNVVYQNWRPLYDIYSYHNDGYRYYNQFMPALNQCFAGYRVKRDVRAQTVRMLIEKLEEHAKKVEQQE